MKRNQLVLFIAVFTSFYLLNSCKTATVANNITPTKTKGEICYKITSKMWNSVTGKAEETSAAIISKVITAFESWNNIEGSSLRLSYAGLAAPSYDSIDEIPRDGCIYIVLNSDYPFLPLNQGGPAGIGGYFGTIPDSYGGGYVFLSTKEAGLYTLRYNILAHEIGHTLGLGHAATNTSVMFCGSQSWGDTEFLHRSEQDTIDLIHLWPDEEIELLSISGCIEGSSIYAGAYSVYAVNPVSGHTYSTMTSRENGIIGSYTIHIGVPGAYRVVAVPDPDTTSAPSQECASWYDTSGLSTNDPYKGSIIMLDSSQPHASNIDIEIIKEKSICNLFWTRTDDTLRPQAIPAFLQPGARVGFYLMFLNGSIDNIRSYGSSSDITIRNQKTGENFCYLDISADSNAVCGDRLFLASSNDGTKTIQAGLIGVHISKRYPQLITIDPRSRNEDDWIHYQIINNVDFSKYQTDW